MRKTTPIFAGCLLSASMLAATGALADDMVQYKITVTNVMPGQPLAPVMAATHRPGLTFFTAGQPASAELATLAESGNPGPLADKLRAMPGYRDAQTGSDLTFPGKSATIMIMAKRGWDHISIAAMLAATNDGFIALNDVPLPRFQKSVTYSADVYDAGSETNDELSSTVPALGGEGSSPNDTGEGFVHIHNGVHGVGNLNAAKMDWRNPAAEITIERMSD